MCQEEALYWKHSDLDADGRQLTGNTRLMLPEVQSSVASITAYNSLNCGRAVPLCVPVCHELKWHHSSMCNLSLVIVIQTLWFLYTVHSSSLHDVAAHTFTSHNLLSTCTFCCMYMVLLDVHGAAGKERRRGPRAYHSEVSKPARMHTTHNACATAQLHAPLSVSTR